MCGWVKVTAMPEGGRRRADPGDAEATAMAYAPFPYHSLDRDGTILAVNDAWLDALGYDHDAVVGEAFVDFLPAEARAGFREVFEEVKTAGEATAELEVQHANGHLLAVVYSGRAEFEGGDLRRTHCQFTDVTERKEREVQLATAQEVANIGRWSKDIPSDEIHWSAEVYDLWGVENGNGPIDHETFRSYVHPDDRARIEYEWAAAKRGVPYDVEHRVVGDDGEVRWMRERAAITFDEAGQPVSATGIVQDITEQKTREQSLTEEREKYRTLVEQGHDGIIVVQNADLVMVNERFAQLAREPSPSAIEGQHFLEYVVPAYRDLVEERYEKRVAGENPESRYEIEVLAADGAKIPVELSTSRIRYEGRVADMAIIRDVSERKARERALRRFERAVESAGQAIYITDPDGTIEYVNPAFEEVTGYSPHEAVGENPRILKSGQMPQSFYADLWETITAGEIWEAEFTNRHKDGSIYHAHQTISPITDDAGEIEGFAAIQADTTERLKREETLRERTERLDLALEGAELGVWDWDMQTNEVYRDEQWAAQLGYEPGEIGDRFADWEAFIHPEDRATHDRALDAHVSGETEYYHCECRVRTKSGDWKWIKNVGKIVEWDGDTPIRAVGIHEDVDEGRRVREQLAQNNDMLEAIDRVLRHNLHNDMNVVAGYAATIQAQGEGPVARQAETIVETSRSLLETVDKERRITQLLTESNPSETFDLVPVLGRVVEGLQERYPEATIESDLPDTLVVTAIRKVEQAIEEVIENAIIHAPKSSPSVEISAERAHGSVRLRIADDGPGIPAMEQEVLTSGAEATPLYHGSGLGLWFVNLVVGHSEGELRFAANEPRGSIVTMQLPAGE